MLQSNPESIVLDAINREKDMAEDITVEDTQSLQISDYEAFLKSRPSEYFPSAFEFISISCPPSPRAHVDSLRVLGIARAKLIEISANLIHQTHPIISHSLLDRLITKIAIGYNNVAYHNFTHGFQLMNLLRKCIQSDAKVANFTTPEQQSLMYIAALAHDINHEGYNNSFYVNLKSPWAQASQGQAVLENMHIRTFFSILTTNQQLNVLKYCENPVLSKQMIVRLILSTDMAKHSDKLKKIRKINKQKSLDEHRSVFMEALFHACDIGNCCINQFHQFVNWTALLMIEFDWQAKMEEKQSMAVTGFMKDSGRASFFTGLIGFNHNLVLPLWKELSICSSGLLKFVDNIQRNLEETKRRDLKLNA